MHFKSNNTCFQRLSLPIEWKQKIRFELNLIEWELGEIFQSIRISFSSQIANFLFIWYVLHHLRAFMNRPEILERNRHRIQFNPVWIRSGLSSAHLEAGHFSEIRYTYMLSIIWCILVSVWAHLVDQTSNQTQVSFRMIRWITHSIWSSGSSEHPDRTNISSHACEAVFWIFKGSEAELAWNSYQKSDGESSAHLRTGSLFFLYFSSEE